MPYSSEDEQALIERTKARAELAGNLYRMCASRNSPHCEGLVTNGVFTHPCKWHVELGNGIMMRSFPALLAAHLTYQAEKAELEAVNTLL